MLVAALCNQKGGVGKTTTALNLARAAHLRGLRVLVADLDPQANSTSMLLGEAPEGTVTMADVLSPRTNTPVKDVIAKTGWAHVDVLPSGGDVLADVGTEIVVMPTGREHRLSRALQSVETLYDLVLLDCPPALDMLTVNGLTAAQRAVIVTTAALWSSEGIARLLTTVGAIKEFANPHLKLTGVIVNALERTRRQRHWFEDLQANAPAPVWLPAIPKATWIAEAAEAGLGLDEWKTPAATVMTEIYDNYLVKILEDATA